MNDWALAVRALRRAPVTTAVAVATIAIGVGAVTTLFSVFDAVWLEPLPFREPASLAEVQIRDSHDRRVGISFANFNDLRARSESFEQLSAFNLAEINTIHRGRAELANAHQVLGDFFSLLGIEAALGRTLIASDEEPNASPVVVLSHSYWITRFGAEPDIIGQQLVIEGGSYRYIERRAYTIVGVLPDTAWYRYEQDLWIPFRLSEAERSARDDESLWPFGRLRPGATPESSQAELRAALRTLEREYPENRGLTLTVEGAHEAFYGDDRKTVALLLSAAALLLLIATGNVAHLVLARVSSRQREIALRKALGAGRASLLKLLSCEAALLAVAGGLSGLWLSFYGVELASNALPRPLLRKIPGGSDAIVLSARVYAFGLIATTFAMLGSSLLPLWRGASLPINRALVLANDSYHRARSRELIVITEVALTLALLIFAGVTVRSYEALHSAPLGFEPNGVLDFWITPSKDRYPGPGERRRFYQDVSDRVNEIPGIGEVGFTNRFPNQIWSSRHEIEVGGGTEDRPVADVRSVDAGYFDVFEIALARGRHFRETDDEQARPVALVNEDLARRHFGDSDPVGRTLGVVTDDGIETLVIVGVVRDVHVPLVADVHPIVYRPWRQSVPIWIDVLVRSERNDAGFAESVRQAIWQVDPNHFVETYDAGDGIDHWFARTRFAASLLGTFAVIAFVLCASGVYAVVSLSVNGRRREMGIRKAVGASDGDLVRLVLGRTLRQSVVGVGVGVAVAFALTRFIADLLYGVGPMDLGTTAAAAALILGVASGATLIPARRIKELEPSRVLRSD